MKKIMAVAHIEFEMEVAEGSTDKDILEYFNQKLYCDGETTILDKIRKYHEKRKAEGKCICEVMNVELLTIEENLEHLDGDEPEIEENEWWPNPPPSPSGTLEEWNALSCD